MSSRPIQRAEGFTPSVFGREVAQQLAQLEMIDPIGALKRLGCLLNLDVVHPSI